ncbi:hypothetical protein [Streptomyces evansiae]|uniref:hypothetical protein n=1 Tax=Streptomyces evansiae TaxID=3075535 RepID=UPI0028845A73|nr:hypothetical protein [Streptomyces sp. DSM 41859]MDT0425506.1 hypothetical protein [Streptomyces sp. DSM 41859]
MSSGTGVEVGALAARSRAAAVLRVKSAATALAVLPAACAVVLWAGAVGGRLDGTGWDAARLWVAVLAVLALALAGATALLIARAAPAESPAVPVEERAAPALYRLVRELAERLGVPAPAAIALTPDCDSWLEERGAAPGVRAQVLVIGSPFLWWLRVAELRALLAPVVAGTEPAAEPTTAQARRFVRGLDAALATAGPRAPLAHRVLLAVPARLARLLLVRCRGAAADMERYVAAACAERARKVDYGRRITAQEQVGLAYAGWDRLLGRVAVPAWRLGRWPARLDAGVAAALAELSRRDRLAADEQAMRLTEPPASELLEEPELADEAASLLAARLFHGERGGEWRPVSWRDYPREVVERLWRADVARLGEVLGEDGRPCTVARVLEHLTVSDSPPERVGVMAAPPLREGGARGGAPRTTEYAARTEPEIFPETPEEEADRFAHPRAAALAAGLAARVAREETTGGAGATRTSEGVYEGDGGLPLFAPPPVRSGVEALADHVTSLVCCAAVDAGGAMPGLDWLDGPVLLVDGERVRDLGARVRSLVEDGDSIPLRRWLARVGVRVG